LVTRWAKQYERLAVVLWIPGNERIDPSAEHLTRCPLPRFYARPLHTPTPPEQSYGPIRSTRCKRPGAEISAISIATFFWSFAQTK
jgi:hypothetical protein